MKKRPLLTELSAIEITGADIDRACRELLISKSFIAHCLGLKAPAVSNIIKGKVRLMPKHAARIKSIVQQHAKVYYQYKDYLN